MADCLAEGQVSYRVLVSGADAVVHPSPDWPYQVPQLGRAPLVVPDAQPAEPVTFTVEVVADDVPAIVETHPITVTQDEQPST